MEVTQEKGKCPFNHENGFKIDFSDPEFITNPFATYAKLRQESPIHRDTLGNGTPCWLVTRYEDAVAIFKDPRFTKDIKKVRSGEELSMAQMAAMSKLFSHHVLYMDPPDHSRLRQMVQRAFTPRLVEAMRPKIEALTNQLLDKAAESGKMDVINDYALPIPIGIISGLLGIPEADQQTISRWTNIIINIDFRDSPEERQKLLPGAIAGFTKYLEDIFEEKRKNPADDLITSLLEIKDGTDKLDENELASTIFLLFAAGYETSVNLIGGGMLALLNHPEQLEMLKNDPGLIKNAIEEMLRIDPPAFIASERYPLEDVEINGVTIPKGELVHISIGSINHDEAVFENPQTFDIQRENNKHLAFGHGIHFCIGSSLGRLEGEVAINTLLKRFPDITLACKPEALVYKRNFVLHALESLPVLLQ